MSASAGIRRSKRPASSHSPGLRGEKIKAFVVLKEGVSATATSSWSIAAAAGEVQSTQAGGVPHGVAKTLVGKVLRRKLLEEELKRAALGTGVTRAGSEDEP